MFSLNFQLIIFDRTNIQTKQGGSGKTTYNYQENFLFFTTKELNTNLTMNSTSGFNKRPFTLKIIDEMMHPILWISQGLKKNQQ